MTDWFYIHYSLKHYQAKCSGLSIFGVYVVIKQIGLYSSTQIFIQFSLCSLSTHHIIHRLSIIESGPSS